MVNLTKHKEIVNFKEKIVEVRDKRKEPLLL